MSDATKVDPLATMDAKVWADEFMRLFGDKRHEIDEGLMIAWFANAIMRGRLCKGCQMKSQSC